MNSREPLLSNGSRAFKNYIKKVLFDGDKNVHRYVPTSHVEILDCFWVGLVPRGTQVGGENAVTVLSAQSVPVFSMGFSVLKQSLRFLWVPAFSKTRGQSTLIGGLSPRPPDVNC